MSRGVVDQRRCRFKEDRAAPRRRTRVVAAGASDRGMAAGVRRRCGGGVVLHPPPSPRMCSVPERGGMEWNGSVPRSRDGSDPVFGSEKYEERNGSIPVFGFGMG
jgi:hypothetical protein